MSETKAAPSIEAIDGTIWQTDGPLKEIVSAL